MAMCPSLCLGPEPIPAVEDCNNNTYKKDGYMLEEVQTVFAVVPLGQPPLLSDSKGRLY